MAAHLVSVLRERVEALIGRLSEAARSDALTGVLNRRGFEELLDRELERARRTDQALSVIMVDLDHFKRLNDRLGHGMGDIALRKV
ncbi:MAG: GGDEF domain-containing protein, partial [Thermoleophilaceae bacterium]|nr:GGDEF domain-containing protein [Thermoleophilaceae bacterium]